MDFLHSVFPDNLACVFISIIDISHQKNFRESTLKIVQKTYNKVFRNLLRLITKMLRIYKKFNHV